MAFTLIFFFSKGGGGSKQEEKSGVEDAYWRGICLSSHSECTRRPEASLRHGRNTPTGSQRSCAAHVPTISPHSWTLSSLDSRTAIASSQRSPSHPSISPINPFPIINFKPQFNQIKETQKVNSDNHLVNRAKSALSELVIKLEIIGCSRKGFEREWLLFLSCDLPQVLFFLWFWSASKTKKNRQEEQDTVSGWSEEIFHQIKN